MFVIAYTLIYIYIYIYIYCDKMICLHLTSTILYNLYKTKTHLFVYIIRTRCYLSKFILYFRIKKV